ncbi:MAG: hypothetical protein VKN60_02565 [Cyanobacteriota bacterium]|nr:hypothetical protein [Cyanobacteriota bacterium]
MLDLILAQALKCSDFKVPFEERPVFEQRHWISVYKEIASSGGNEHQWKPKDVFDKILGQTGCLERYETSDGNTVGVYRWYGKSPEGRPRGFQIKFLEDSTHTKKRGSLIWKGEGF